MYYSTIDSSNKLSLIIRNLLDLSEEDSIWWPSSIGSETPSSDVHYNLKDFSLDTELKFAYQEGGVCTTMKILENEEK